MGNPTFFKPLSIRRGDSVVTFLDAGDNHYNPVFDVVEEAELVYPTRHITYLLSLGSGTASTVGENSYRIFVNRPRLPNATLATLRHLAHCCDHVATVFERGHGSLGRKYFRLTPNNPLRDGRIPWEEADDLDAIVAPYIDSVKEQVRVLSSLMMRQRAMNMARGGRS